MDSLAGLLNGPRAQGAFLLRCVMVAPWAIRLEDQAPLSLTAVVRGRAWVRLDDADPVRLDAGDLVIRVGSAPWTLSDTSERAPSIWIDADQGCTTASGTSVAEQLSRGVRSWGTAPSERDAEDVLLTGVYLGAGEVGRRVLAALPPAVVVRSADLSSPLVALLATEVVRDAPGQEAVLDRLLDLLLITALREHFDRPGSAAPHWYAALADPVVGRALQLMQHHPEQAWTVAGLAAEAGQSRAAFARRFTDLVGRPPMAFLTQWRLDVAADLLAASDITMARVAREVGYASPFALSTAFKRERGESPRDYRARARAS